MKYLYKKNLDQAVERNEMFWTRNGTNKILAKIDIDGNYTVDLWIKALSPEYCPDHKKMFDVFIEQFESRKDLLDDAIPTARPSFGGSVYGAFFGADVEFGETGGYSKHIINNINDVKNLHYDFNNHWLKKQIEATEYFVKKSDGICGVSIIETMDGLNLATNIAGPDIYIYLLDNPRKVLELFELGFEFNVKLIEKQREHIKKYKGGYFDIHEEWLPNNGIWLSIDQWGLCSSELFKKMGKHHLQKIIDYFGGGWLHMHNSDLHLLEEVSTIKNFLGIGILDDPNEPRCFPKLKEIQKITKDIPLQINCSKEELVNGISTKTLPRNVMYWVDRGVKSIEEANSIMDMVYDY
jgi:hypothetical protein